MEFADRVSDMLDEQIIVREGLAYEGPRLVEYLCRNQSLRQLSRESGLSPTYLSQVRNARTIISPEAYVSLAQLKEHT